MFHDATLERLTGGTGRFDALLGPERDRLTLTGTAETIPRLREILDLVAGRVPILIEVKAPGRLVGVLCLSVRRALEGYRGQVAVMSFNPQVGRWFHDHAPRIVRGLVVTEQQDTGRLRNLRGRATRHAALWRARPDFLAYDVRDLPSDFAKQQRDRGLPVVTWTVRSAADEAIARTHADEAVYERG